MGRAVFSATMPTVAADPDVAGAGAQAGTVPPVRPLSTHQVLGGWSDPLDVSAFDSQRWLYRRV